MPELPAGTVTFLFTDIEGSTQLWEQHPEAMQVALARHDALLRQAIESHGGHVFKTMGDQFCAVFALAPGALAAALAAQQALQAEPWAETLPERRNTGTPERLNLRVRIALHTGAAEARAGDYYGPALNRIARCLAVAHGGQILLSAATEELARASLPGDASLRDLGAHRLKDLQQPEHLFQLLHPSLLADFPPLRSHHPLRGYPAFAHNLPRQVTRFIGREQEMAVMKQLLSSTALLTLTGSGGCGKTRLALQVAAELLEEYPDGVWLVELAPLSDPALVPQEVASALGVREEPNRPLTTTLTDYLRPKSLLLILDNCEHLLAASAQLAESLLRACPKLRVLASSREGLGIGGEQTYRVPSLALPDARHLPPLERLRDFEAVQLFADRARLSQSTFAVTLANAASVVQVCQRLDGIPLAIELAAARVRALPVEQIHTRLDDMFRLLTGGSRTALPRQQTLRALIDWSYDLLSEGERTLLRRLSVFAGGWTLEAAEAVGAGGSVEAWELLDLLTSLVDKSLVAYDEQGGEGRYRLLETVRQYARERLLAGTHEVGGGEAAAVRSRHLEFFLRLAEQAEPELNGPDQVAWLDRLEREHDNLRAALAWSRAAVDSGQWLVDGPAEAGSQTSPALLALTTNDYPPTTAVEKGLRLGGALGEFWEVRGYWTEGQEHLAGLLALPGAQARTAARARALHGAGLLAWQQGEFGAARARLEESVAISRELGNQEDLAGALVTLGLACHFHGDDGAARAQLEESLGIFRELGVKTGIARSLDGLGLVSRHQGEYGAARALLEECLAISREVGNRQGSAGALVNLGAMARAQGEYGAARALLEESLALFRELGDKFGITLSLMLLGWTAHDQGEYGAARAVFEERLAIAQELGNKHLIAWALCDLGGVARLQGDDGAAAALYEESLAISRGRGDKKGIVNSLIGLAHVSQASAWALRNLGGVARLQGDDGAAAALYEESLAISRGRGDKEGVVNSLIGLAHVSQASGNPEKARALLEEARAIDAGTDACMEQGHFLLEMGDYSAARSRYEEGLALQRERGNASSLIASALLEVGHAAWLQGEPAVTQSHAREALALFQEGGNKAGLLAALESLAVAALAQGKKEHAARLLGGDEALREALGLPAPDWWRRSRERMREAVRAAGLDQEFAAAWAEGRAMSLELAVEYALGKSSDA